MTQTPFPTVFEVIRFIATSFDTKASNKQLDDLARDVFADYREVAPNLNRLVVEPLSKYVEPIFSKELGAQLGKLLEDYLELVSLKSVDGLTREQILPIIVSHWFVPNAINALKALLAKIPEMPSVFLLLGNSQQALKSVFEWADENVATWCDYVSALSKEQKDQLANWRKGKYLPDLQSLHLLVGKKNNLDQVARTRVMTLLIIARGIDSLRSSSLGEIAIEEARQQLMGAKPYGNPFRLLEQYQQEARVRVEPVRPHLEYLFNHLRRTLSKEEGAQQHTRQCLDDLTCKLKDLSEYEASKHKVAQLVGRWHVFSGDLKGACKHYGFAVEAALYRAGNELSEILEEAFCVAAKANNTVLMRKIKNSQVLFKVDLESVNQELVGRPRKKTEQFLQDWEVKAWSKQFERMFPNSGLFLNTPDYEPDLGNGPILYLTNKEIKPDYRNPDRKIKIGHKTQKTWPQICWFILQDQFDVVEKLIEKGASVDVESSSGDTPLIMALEKLVLMEIPYRSRDDRYWRKFLLIPGVDKTVNVQTHKKKLTPIIQAVNASRPDIVEKLLELGAEVDLRGEADGQTALNTCLKLIGIIKRPKKWLEIQRDHPITPELLDAFRRHSNGVMGADLESQKRFLKIHDFNKWMDEFHRAAVDRLLKYASVIDMQKILLLLLKAGANPNQRFKSPRPEYTPTMLAAELDLRYELELMLMYGADLDLTSPALGIEENSWDIAQRNHSQNVLRLMEDIKPYYTVQ